MLQNCKFCPQRLPPFAKWNSLWNSTFRRCSDSKHYNIIPLCLRCMCLLIYIYNVKYYLYWIISVKKKLFQVSREAIQLGIVHIQEGVVFCEILNNQEIIKMDNLNGDKKCCFRETIGLNACVSSWHMIIMLKHENMASIIFYIRWTTLTGLFDFSHTAASFIPLDKLTDHFFFLTLRSLNIERNLTKVTCHCER